MTTFLTILHSIVCVFLILVVLLQAGKGGGMGIAFGGAGSQTVFGSSGAGNFLTRLTSITAVIFMVTSLGLAHYSSQQDSKRLQKIAEQKAAQKKSEDERAAKLKTELEKALQSKPAAGGGAAPSVVPLPAPATETPIKPDSAAAKGAKESAKDSAAKGAKGAKGEKTTAPDGEPAKDGEAKPKPATPQRKKKAPPKEEGAAPAAPAAAPAPAPAE